MNDQAFPIYIGSARAHKGTGVAPLWVESAC